MKLRVGGGGGREENTTSQAHATRWGPYSSRSVSACEGLFELKSRLKIDYFSTEPIEKKKKKRGPNETLSYEEQTNTVPHPRSRETSYADFGIFEERLAISMPTKELKTFSTP